MTSKRNDNPSSELEEKKLDDTEELEEQKELEPESSQEISPEEVEDLRQKLEEKAEELRTFLLEGFSFKSTRGEKIKVPPLRGKAEKGAILALTDFIITDPGTLALFASSKKGFNIIQILRLLSRGKGDEAFECMQKMAASLLEKSTEWVDEHLLIMDMVEIIRPFFFVEGDWMRKKFENSAANEISKRQKKLKKSR